MKLAIRALAFVIALTGVAAATVSSSSAKHPAQNHQTLSSTLPGPVCFPGLPTCPKN